VYLVAVMDWFSRRVLAWRVSIGLDTSFCVEALREYLLDPDLICVLRGNSPTF